METSPDIRMYQHSWQRGGRPDCSMHLNVYNFPGDRQQWRCTFMSEVNTGGKVELIEVATGTLVGRSEHLLEQLVQVMTWCSMAMIDWRTAEPF